VEADVVASEVEHREGKRFERMRIATREGIAVAFYRRVDVASSGDASFLAVLLDEIAPGRWAALSASEVPAGGSRRISMRPSEGRGDWVVAFYGSAPAGAEVAVIEYEGVHRVPVEAGVYGFMLRAVSEPAILRGGSELDPISLRPRFE
jgi:hypothetical protein